MPSIEPHVAMYVTDNTNADTREKKKTSENNQTATVFKRARKPESGAKEKRQRTSAAVTKIFRRFNPEFGTSLLQNHFKQFDINKVQDGWDQMTAEKNRRDQLDECVEQMDHMIQQIRDQHTLIVKLVLDRDSVEDAVRNALTFPKHSFKEGMQSAWDEV